MERSAAHHVAVLDGPGARAVVPRHAAERGLVGCGAVDAEATGRAASADGSAGSSTESRLDANRSRADIQRDELRKYLLVSSTADSPTVCPALRSPAAPRKHRYAGLPTQGKALLPRPRRPAVRPPPNGNRLVNGSCRWHRDLRPKLASDRTWPRTSRPSRQPAGSSPSRGLSAATVERVARPRWRSG